MSVFAGGAPGSGAGSESAATVPRPGMLATVRNRHGLVAAVEPFDAAGEGRFHLVHIEYLDSDTPREDHLVWEREVARQLLEPIMLPNVTGEQPMAPDELDALTRAVRWTALSPAFDPDGTGPVVAQPVSAPLHAAVQIEDFQLVPVLKALRMPRVALMLADDVGLGKTVEAGMVLTELLLRRRIRKVLVLCPAALRRQWKDELKDKFSLAFDVVDRGATHALQRRLGLDANPWRTFPRIIASYDYLKQLDVLEQFRSACRVPEGSPYLPWDLLIVDECHNLAPAPYGEESDLTRMLRAVTPFFEHKLFLTATPHNGYTRSFTGLLECLDPVRFTQKTDPLSEPEKRRVQQVVVRRMKSEINARTSPPKFSGRYLTALPLSLSPGERSLSEAFARFRARVRQLMASGARSEQLAGAFAVEVLGKRLLSCPVAFADTWRRYVEGMTGPEGAGLEEVRAARISLGEGTDDDSEAEARGAHAARTVGAWLRPLAQELGSVAAEIEDALRGLGLGDQRVPALEFDPRSDSRFDALRMLAGRIGAAGDKGVEGERLIVFTEYKTTLKYLVRRLAQSRPEPGAVRVLFGGMDEAEREAIKAAFNAPSDPVRILIATDAAAEGINLQQSARHVLHFDIPWNPARLEQRNGRLDRHGQAWDVAVYHFTSDDDRDLSFLAYVAQKVNTIREDLGSVGQVFDSAIERRLVRGEDDSLVRSDLEASLERARGQSEIPSGLEGDPAVDSQAVAGLEALKSELDLTPRNLQQTLDVALGIGIGRPRLDGPDGRGRFRLKPPLPPDWNWVIDESLRVGGDSGGRSGLTRGALASLVFDPSGLVKLVGQRPVFRPDPDAVLIHLSHPIMKSCTAAFMRRRFPGTRYSASRWSVRRGPVPAGADALVLLTVEELGVNELRETFHHWVRTLRYPVCSGSLGGALPHEPAESMGLVGDDLGPTTLDVQTARAIWDEVAHDVREVVQGLASQLTGRLSEQLESGKQVAVEEEEERFRSRQGEISALIETTTLQRLEREIEELKSESAQLTLFGPAQNLEQMQRSIAEKTEEVKRRCAHYEELREQLRWERERVVCHILLKRYALHGEARVLPVSVEIRLPGERGSQ